METTRIEALFHEKLMMYRELAETLKEEKKWIIHADVDALWRVSEKKQSLAVEIEVIRGRILEALDAVGIDHGMTTEGFRASGIMSLLPTDVKRRLVSARVAISTLKEEIQAVSRENKQYIESYLGMLDDLMCVLTGTEQQPQVYQPDRRVSPSGGAQVLHREV